MNREHREQPNVSYREVCEGAANDEDYLAPLAEAGGYGAPVRLRAAALRRLALEIGKLEQPLTPLGAQEFTPTTVALDFAAFCAAGFAPGEEGK